MALSATDRTRFENMGKEVKAAEEADLDIEPKVKVFEDALEKLSHKNKQEAIDAYIKGSWG